MDDGSIRVRLLMVEAVQKDLGLTADQIGKLRDCVKVAGEEYRENVAKAREILPPSRHFSPEEYEARQGAFRAFTEELRSKQKASRTKILAMLTPSQGERLKQIQLQVAIPAALARPEIIKALNISEEQRGKIRALCDRVDEKLLAALSHLGDLSPKERRQKMIEFMKESDKAQAEANKPILDVLTPEQRAKLEKLQGKKIEVTWPYDALMPEDGGF
ncbi:MAG: Spy/CpxP family protein refolding chaperone [Thermoguttaceae bacterium]